MYESTWKDNRLILRRVGCSSPKRGRVEKVECDLEMVFSDNEDDAMVQQGNEDDANLPQAPISEDSTGARRFGEVSEMDLERARRNNMLSDKTNEKTRWAVRLYEAWATEKGELPLSELRCDADINANISRFILEARRLDGQEYPPSTLHEIVICLQRALNSEVPVKLLKSHCYKEVQATLDAEMKRLTALGRNKRVQKDVVTADMESILWEKGALGSRGPHQLLDTLVFVLGKHLALRGKFEQRELKWRNFQLLSPLRLRFEQESNKTNQGGLLHRKVARKCVDVVGYTEQEERCPVRLFLRYKSLCPVDATTGDGPFYLTPKKVMQERLWYTATPVGVNQLLGAVKRRCALAGIKGNFSNHSMRATAATRMYKSGVPEELTQSVTGHRSLEALRQYNRIDDEQRAMCSRAIEGVPHAPVLSEPQGSGEDNGSVAEKLGCNVVVYNYGTMNFGP